MKKTHRKTATAIIKQTGEDGSFEAVIATFGEVDSDGDIVERGAFGGATVSVLPTHQSQHVPLGKATIEERGDEAVAVGQLNLEIPAAQEWHSALKFDLANPPAVQEWSWGFRIEESTEETVDGEPIRRLVELDMLEVSPVLRGASVGTRTLGVKASKAHSTGVTTAPWDAPVSARRLKTGAKTSGAYALLQGDRGLLLHHVVAEDGTTGAASAHACLAGIATLKAVRGDSALDAVDRKAAYDHLAAHLKDGNLSAPKLLDESQPGLPLLDQVRLAMWDTEAAVARLDSVAAERALGVEAKAAALRLAEQHLKLRASLHQLVESMLPDDQAVQAAARFMATEVAHHLKD